MGAARTVLTYALAWRRAWRRAQRGELELGPTCIDGTAHHAGCTACSTRATFDALEKLDQAVGYLEAEIAAVQGYAQLRCLGLQPGVDGEPDEGWLAVPIREALGSFVSGSCSADEAVALVLDAVGIAAPFMRELATELRHLAAAFERAAGAAALGGGG